MSTTCEQPTVREMAAAKRIQDLHAARGNSTRYILTLARQFPVLEPQLRRYNPAQFDGDEWERISRPWSTTERWVALFILSVWNPSDARKRKARFDFVEAVSGLDDSNLQPILEWACNPYWP